jgi:hypothetical protein
MGGQEQLTAREFYKGIERIEARFDRRFDTLDEKIDSHGERIAVLEAAAKSKTRKSVGWSSAAATVIVAVFEGVRAYLKT